MATDTETPPKTTPQATTTATVAEPTPQATKPEADAKTPAKAAPRAAGTKTSAKTARRAAGTKTPAKTARRATGTKTPRKPARRATKPVTDTKVPAKTTPRATKPVSAPFDVEGALKQWTETARKATEGTLALYVKTVDRLADAEVKAAQASKLPIVATIAETNAAVSRRIASAYVAAARDLLKA
jgi:hypothetical protein